MKRLLSVLIAVLAVAVSGCGQELAEQIPPTQSNVVPFKVVFSVDMQEIAGEGQVYFVDEYAVEMADASVQAIYHLERMSCREPGSDKTFVYRHCEAWIDASVEKTEESIAETTDEEVKRFAESMIHPRLKTLTTQDGSLLLSNEVYVYEITSSQFPSGDQNRRFFRFSQLLACRNTMMAGRGVLPIPWLAAVDILSDRGIFPNEIQTTVKLPDGDVIAHSAFTIEEMTPSELEMIRSLLAE
jgi:hypothetical protein